MTMLRTFRMLLAASLVSACYHSDDVVRPPVTTPVASVGVTPGAFVMTIGESRQMTATPRDADGNLLAGRSVQWSVDDARVASIGATGQLKGLGHGYVTITATSEGKSSSVAATVVPPEVGTQ
jgi:uncharacterized protein YjdB